MRECRQCCSPWRDLLSIVCQERGSQRLRHACTAIVGSAASNADDKMTASAIQGRQDQLSHAVGCGDAWVASSGGHKRQASGGSHFNCCCATVAEHSEEGYYRFTQWACHDLLHDIATCGVYQCLHRSLATICDGHDVEVCCWVNGSYAVRNGLSSFSRRQASFQRLRSDDDTHRVTFLVCHLR